MNDRLIDSEYFIFPILFGFLAASFLWGWLYFSRIEPRLRARTERRLGIKIFRKRGNWAVERDAGCRMELTVLALDLLYSLTILFGGIFSMIGIVALIGVLLRDVYLS